LRITEQGFAIPETVYQTFFVRRTKRSNDFIAYDLPDSVRPDQLSSQLTASSVSTTRATQRLFARECQRSQLLPQEPTNAARKLLKTNNIMARWSTFDILEIWPCASYNFSAVSFRIDKKKCYRYVPIYFKTPWGTEIKGFLDGQTNILSKSSPEADCLVFREHIIQLSENEYISFDSQDGNITQIDNQSIHSLNEVMDTEGFSALDFNPLSFHELILHNITSDFLGQHIGELSRINQYKTHGEIIKTSQATSLGGNEGGIGGIGKSLILKYLSLIKETWVVTCCILVTIFTLAKVLEWSACAPIVLISILIQAIGRMLWFCVWTIPCSIVTFILQRRATRQTARTRAQVLNASALINQTPAPVRRPIRLLAEPKELASTELNTI
jgi:hypothetical protein